MTLSAKDLQVRLVEIYKCLNEAQGAIESGDDESLQACLHSIREEADDLKECLPEHLLIEFEESISDVITEDIEIDDIAESIDGEDC